MDKKYPGDWPEPIVSSKQGCPDISGAYNNPDQDGSSEYLFDSIINEGVFGRHECKDCKVILEWADPEQNQLSAILQGTAGSTLEATLLEQDRGEFSCTEGAIHIKYLFVAEIVIMGAVRSGTRKYYQAEDGSLILEDHYSVVGHYFYLPGASKSIDYSRWLRVDAKGQELATEYEARNLVLAGHTKETNETEPPDHYSPESMTGNTSAQWWERFKGSSAHGDPDIKALCKAADLGDYRARREMGYLYYHGLHGVRKDPVLSAMWYGLVESRRPGKFSTGREQLTPEQLTELKSLYINWKPGQCEREIYGIDADTN